MSKIEVGILTCGVRKINPVFDNIDHEVYVDKERIGAARGKNELIKLMLSKGAEYMFIFDDDCYPVIPGWEDKIIEWSKRNKVHYLAGIDYKNANLQNAFGDTLISVNPYIGAFFFLDRKCIEKVGMYNEKYIKYGWEDVGYSIRANKAGMTGGKGWFSPAWINMYIHSMDMFCECSEPNMSQDDKNKYIELNREEFNMEVNNG